jgi:hypothetical protein
VKKSLNRRLLTIIGIGWLSFLITGLIIVNVFAASEITLLIDRSYCPPNQWQKVVENYRDFYIQNQEKKIKITSVILFSDLAEETLNPLPTPEQISQINTYGKPNPDRQKELQNKSISGKILSCQ